ncbi:MAG: hypothetical protein NW214_04145 [Pseudanabaenaceae cyanobacterium bins.39]|nr:hypothetical protein [Pseudanabaenaceae cyanobacterium bins.39]
MIIIKYSPKSRKYRTRRTRRTIPANPAKRISAIAYICKAIAVFLFIASTPLLIMAVLPLLIALAIVTLADKINNLGGQLDEL